MISISPAILAENPDEFRARMEAISMFATRVHVDLADGTLADGKTIPIDEVWWPGGVRADLHVMFLKPFEHVDAYLALGPQMVIVHAEAEGDFLSFANTMHKHGIEVGVALMPDTPVETIRPAAPFIDHILIFSGNLGHYGGEADLGLLAKAKDVRELSRRIEIGWDGGVNDQNIRHLSEGGIQVVDVGGFISHAENQAVAYERLRNQIS
jgi:ribulose-phosphate 3-epimerase